MRADAISRISPGKIGQLVAEFAVRVGNVERLHETQARSARRRLIDPIGFQTSAICHNDERGRCHSDNIFGSRTRGVSHTSISNSCATTRPRAKQSSPRTKATKVTTDHGRIIPPKTLCTLSPLCESSYTFPPARSSSALVVRNSKWRFFHD